MSALKDALQVLEQRPSLNFFNALRLVALRDVLKEPSDYHLRHIFRWYSRNFHVPLPDVADLPMEDVLTNFYEAKYEDMDADQREDERLLLIQSDEERQKRAMDEDRDAYDTHEFEREAEELAKEQQAAKAKKGRDERDDKLIVPDLPSGMKLPTMMPDSGIDPLEPPPLKPGQKLPGGISMKFVSDADLQRLIQEADEDDEKMDVNPRGNLPKVSPSHPTLK